MAKMFHAHPGDAEDCIVPPSPEFACPFPTREEAFRNEQAFAKAAIRFAWESLNNMTTEEFHLGGDRYARQALHQAYEVLHGIQLDPWNRR